MLQDSSLGGGGASQVALVIKNPPASARDIRDARLIPGSGWSPGEGNGNPFQYSCLENPIEEPGSLPSTGSRRVRHNWATEHTAHTPWKVKYSSVAGIQGLALSGQVRRVTDWSIASNRSRRGSYDFTHAWLLGKDPDAGKDWRQEKGMTEDEIVGWHHWLDGHEFKQAPGVGDGQGGLMCCSPWGRKESDMTERLNWLTEVERMQAYISESSQLEGSYIVDLL